MKNFFITKLITNLRIYSSFFFLLQIILVKNFYYKINLSNYISMNLYESMNFISLLFLILYLLLTLVCVVKLVKFEYGPLIKRLYNYFDYSIFNLFNIFNRLKI